MDEKLCKKLSKYEQYFIIFESNKRTISLADKYGRSLYEPTIDELIETFVKYHTLKK